MHSSFYGLIRYLSLAEGSQYLLDDPRTSFISWEVERAIIPIGRVRFDENSNWKHLNEFVDIYTKMLEPGWMSQLDLVCTTSWTSVPYILPEIA